MCHQLGKLGLAPFVWFPGGPFCSYPEVRFVLISRSLRKILGLVSSVSEVVAIVPGTIALSISFERIWAILPP